MQKCYVSHASADDVAVFLRDHEAREIIVIAPLDGASFTGVARLDDGDLSETAALLASAFNTVLVVEADAEGWSLQLLGPEPLEVRTRGLLRDDCRKAAQRVSKALSAPRITTALERALRRGLTGTAALERVGEALQLSHCAHAATAVVADAAGSWLKVDGQRIRGRIHGAKAGAGYASVGELLEDVVTDLLERGRVEAALLQLRGYHVHLSLDDDRNLRCSAPQGLLTPGLREALARHRESVCATLADASNPG